MLEIIVSRKVIELVFMVYYYYQKPLIQSAYKGLSPERNNRRNPIAEISLIPGLVHSLAGGIVGGTSFVTTLGVQGVEEGEQGRDETDIK